MKKAVIFLVGSLFCGQAFGMQKLPAELIEEIVSFGGSKSMKKCFFVCKEWNEIIASRVERLCERLFGKDYKAVLEKLYAKHDNDEVLDLVLAVAEKNQKFLESKLDEWKAGFDDRRKLYEQQNPGEKYGDDECTKDEDKNPIFVILTFLQGKNKKMYTWLEKIFIDNMSVYFMRSELSFAGIPL